MRKKFDFNDFTIIPETVSSINSRAQVDETYFGKLPLMVSPMDTVIDNENIELFHKLGFIPCVPRGCQIGGYYNHFKSISLEDFENMVEYGLDFPGKLLVDVANGHMDKLHSLCERFLSFSHHTELMVGNIANPETYRKFAEIGVSYVRVGIGGGSGCLTSANLGVHYPVASLINECYDIKVQHNYRTKIVADGGFKNYDEIIKALVLGADYVMLGGILNKTLESCAKTKLFNLIPLPKQFAVKMWDYFPKLRKYFYKDFRGMSTKEVQKKWGKDKLKTSEGIKKTNKVEYKLGQWTENFRDYLKSAMSYTNSKNLESFKESQIVFITDNARKRFAK